MKFLSPFATLSLLFAAANAHVGSVSTSVSELQVTPTSTLPLTFKTNVSPTNNLDFSVVVGLAPATANTQPPLLGEIPLQNFDLVALGHSATGTGSFTLDVPVNTNNIGIFTSGNYTFTAAVTSAFGAYYGTQLEFYQVYVQLTV